MTSDEVAESIHTIVSGYSSSGEIVLDVVPSAWVFDMPPFIGKSRV
jgi:hypothetical protein